VLFDGVLNSMEIILRVFGEDFIVVVFKVFILMSFKLNLDLKLNLNLTKINLFLTIFPFIASKLTLYGVNKKHQIDFIQLSKVTKSQILPLKEIKSKISYTII